MRVYQKLWGLSGMKGVWSLEFFHLLAPPPPLALSRDFSFSIVTDWLAPYDLSMAC